jgi:hypothetical protein
LKQNNIFSWKRHKPIACNLENPCFSKKKAADFLKDISSKYTLLNRLGEQTSHFLLIAISVYALMLEFKDVLIQ